MRHPLILAAAGCFTLSGGWLVNSAHAQSNQDTNTNSPRPDFVKCEQLLDAKVTSSADEGRTAEVVDFVVDTRNGRFVYGVLDTGGLFGVNEQRIAIPYGALTWERKGRYSINATADQLKALPRWNGNDLAHLQTRSWMSTLRGIFGEQPELADDLHQRGDEYTSLFQERSEQTIKGEIAAIEPSHASLHDRPMLAIMIDAGSGEQWRTVLLAPETYITNEGRSPSEGMRAAAVVVAANDANGKHVYVARNVTIDGKRLSLRDDEGRPRWTDDEPGDYLMLASDIDDATLYADGAEFGGVSSCVIEAHSGTAAFAIVAHGGVLGVDSTLYPVPCRAIVVGPRQDFHVELPAEKLKLAPKLSEDGADDLANRGFAQRVFDYFGVTHRAFDTGRSANWSSARALRQGGRK